MNNQGQIPQPDLRSVLDAEAASILSRINGMRIGRIASFAANGTASIDLVNPISVYNTAPTGDSMAIPTNPTLYKIPTLVGVPVFVLSGGSAFIGMPVQAGDFAAVFFSDRDLDPWLTTGTVGAVPNTTRMHSFSDAIAFVGFRPMSSPFSGLPTDGQHIAFQNAQTSLLAIQNAVIATLSATIAACSSLDAVKSGGSAAAAIAAAQAQLNALTPLPPELLQ